MAKKCAECGEKLKLTNRHWQYIDGVFTEFCSDEHRAAYEGRARHEAQLKSQPATVVEKPVVEEELSPKERIRTFLLGGGRKAAIAGFCVPHGCLIIFYLAFILPKVLNMPDAGLAGLASAAFMAIGGFFAIAVIGLFFATPSYYLMKLVVPKSFQTGLYDFYTGFIAALVLPLLVWWAYF